MVAGIVLGSTFHRAACPVSLRVHKTYEADGVLPAAIDTSTAVENEPTVGWEEQAASACTRYVPGTLQDFPAVTGWPGPTHSEEVPSPQWKRYTTKSPAEDTLPPVEKT